jgi:AraC-like DNA-binding protein
MYAHMPLIRDIVFEAVNRGASLATLCQALNVTVDELCDSELKMDFERACKAWETSVLLTKDNLLGLHMGESTTTSILGMVGNLMQSSPDLLTAFETLSKYFSTASDMFHYGINVSGDEATLTYEPAALWNSTSPQTARHSTERSMSGTLRVFYLLTGKQIKPVRASFRHKREGNMTEYTRVFDVTPRFGAEANELVFPKSTILTRVVSHDRSLFSVFEKMLREKKSKTNEPLKSQIRRLLISDFRGQIPSLEIISAQIHMTPRTVQRKLTEEGTTFRALTADIQRELATRFMKMKGSNLSQVSGFLGYSDPSAFRRAYKKWRTRERR